MNIRVCVIGAGAAGLCALRHLSAAPEKFSCMAYEQSENVGGTWVYTPETGPKVHASMYRDLRTNLPKEVMAFLDFPFPSGPSFVHHSAVRSYLQDYAHHFNLTPHIKFGHQVEAVVPVTGGDQVRWNVTVRATNSDQLQTDEFDSVIICNGHYFKTFTPTIPDMKIFKGGVMHSHDYRSPEIYTGQKVLLLGAHSSGQDIAVEISRTAAQVILSHNHPPLKGHFPDNVIQRPGISRATETGFVLKDGTSCDVDSIMFCTGFDYYFPFLAPECRVIVKDNCVQPLYKHCIHTHFPSLVFVGLPSTVIPFPLFDIQVQFALKILSGEVTLPTESEMNQDAKLDLDQRCASLGLRPRQGHTLSDTQWSYVGDLARVYGVPHYPAYLKPLYDEITKRRAADFEGYKNTKIHFDVSNGDPSFKVE